VNWANISVVIIARNAAAVLDAALDSVPREAELIVADGGSQDTTIAIARRHGARVIAQDQAALAAAGGNFDVVRNQAGTQATRHWIFHLDADERLTPELTDEIRGASVDDRVAFDMPRTNLFWGKPVRLLGEDRHVRLVRTGRGVFPSGNLHQEMRVDGAVGHLGAPLRHENVRRWADVRQRFRLYIPVEARYVTSRPSWRRCVTVPGWYVLFYLFRQQAWRDGWRGLLVSVIYALYHGAVLWRARRNGSCSTRISSSSTTAQSD
jgi:glycosyltransferase involved in cell wall biosynthesis